MFYIQAMLCLLHIQNMPVPVCFSDATIPYSFETIEECSLKRDDLVLIINDDPDVDEYDIKLSLSILNKN